MDIEIETSALSIHLILLKFVAYVCERRSFYFRKERQVVSQSSVDIEIETSALSIHLILLKFVAYVCERKRI